MGSATPCGKKIIAIYDSDKYIKILMKEFDINMIEAFEQFQSYTNTLDSLDSKPIFFSNFSESKEPKI